MRQLMRDDAGQFLAAERLHQPGGDGDGGVLRIAAGGKRVRLRIVHQEHARHRQFGPRGKLADHAIQLGRGARIDLMRAIHRQHHAVGIPVGKQIGRRGDDQRDHRAARPADQIADAHEQAGETGQQDRGSQIAHRFLQQPRHRAALHHSNGNARRPYARRADATPRRVPNARV